MLERRRIATANPFKPIRMAVMVCLYGDDYRSAPLQAILVGGGAIFFDVLVSPVTQIQHNPIRIGYSTVDSIHLVKHCIGPLLERPTRAINSVG